MMTSMYRRCRSCHDGLLRDRSQNEGVGMKTNLAMVLSAYGLIFGLMSGCSLAAGDGDSDRPSDSASVSASPSESGVDSYTFEGDGDDDYVETGKVELSGEYNAVWEISGNVAVDGSDGVFEAKLKGKDEQKVLFSRTVVSENIAEGSGEILVKIVDPGEYHLQTFSQPGADWKVTLTRVKE